MPRFDIVTRCKDDADLLMPCKSTMGSVGYDLKCAEDIIVPSTLKHFLKEAHLTGGVTRETPQLVDLGKLLVQMENSYGQRIRPTLVPTGLKVYCEPNEYFAVKSRSSYPLKYMLLVANSEGVVDSDYADNPTNEGEIYVQVLNLSPFDVCIPKGTKIAQGMFIATVPSENGVVKNASRQGGHGSTGN